MDLLLILLAIVAIAVLAMRQAPLWQWAATALVLGLVSRIGIFNNGSFAGDLPGLRRYYDLTLTGSAAAWQLRLRPRDPALARFIRVIVITGANSRIAAIDTASADGSDSRMSIAPTDAP